VAIIVGGMLLLSAGETVGVLAPVGTVAIDLGLRQLGEALALRQLSIDRLDPASTAVPGLVVVIEGKPSMSGLSAPSVADLGPEGYRIARLSCRGGMVTAVVAKHTTGAMYGLGDLADHVRAGGTLATVTPRTARPRLAFRALKFNLPWMSYRRNPSLQLHDATCRDLVFWESFLDMMAANRFNALSLWSMHPFHLMVRLPDFPEACALSDAELAQWQTFWRGLFRMAKERGIETYLVNWNIFVSPAFARAHNVATWSNDGDGGQETFFGEADTSDLVKRYTRSSITQVINTYEDLTGLGITLGERMGGMTPRQREDWLTETIVAGMKDARRRVKFIHRAPLSAGTDSGGSTTSAVSRMTTAAIAAMALPEPALVELKYNWSHGHSTPILRIVHGGRIADEYWNPPPTAYRIAWTVRNEDFFALRWGEPGFIRAMLRNNSQPWVAGCFIGSECYIPAADYLSVADARRTWRYSFERQWLFYRQWGRLLYDPETPDAVFVADFDARYGAGTGAALQPAYTAVSRMPLRLASYMNSSWDNTLYSEGFISAGRGGDPFISVDELISVTPLEPTYLAIGAFVDLAKKGRSATADQLTPLALADALERDADDALRRIAPLAQRTDAIAFELADIRAWAALSRYFADKLRGGVALALFRATGEATQQAKAIQHLESALKRWDEVIAITSPVHPEVSLVHTGQPFSWARFRKSVEQDVATARSATAKK